MVASSFTWGDLAYLALAVFLVVVGLSLGYAFLRLGETFGRLSAFIRGTERELLPVITKVGGTVEGRAEPGRGHPHAARRAGLPPDRTPRDRRPGRAARAHVRQARGPAGRPGRAARLLPRGRRGDDSRLARGNDAHARGGAVR